MFGCAMFGEAYFGDVCAEGGVPPAPAAAVGGAFYPIKPRRPEPVDDFDEFAILLALGYVE